jgi:guanylate kinase
MKIKRNKMNAINEILIRMRELGLVPVVIVGPSGHGKKTAIKKYQETIQNNQHYEK